MATHSYPRTLWAYTMKVMIDLFCGLGGASSAFAEDLEWHVLGFDNNPELIGHFHTGCVFRIVDMQTPIEVIRIIDAYLDGEDVEKMVVWASPPCTEFSTGNPNRGHAGFDTTLLTNTMIVLNHLCGKYPVAEYIIENVKGATTTFNPILGDYKQRVGPFFFWGRFTPIPMLSAETHRHRKPFNSTNSRTPLRSNIHAKVPFEVSEAWKNNVDDQAKLWWFE